MHARVEKIAREHLQMRVPPAARVRMVVPRSPSRAHRAQAQR